MLVFPDLFFFSTADVHVTDRFSANQQFSSFCFLRRELRPPIILFYSCQRLQSFFNHGVQIHEPCGQTLSVKLLFVRAK